MAPFALKLWENAFEMIPDISSFDFENYEIFRFLVVDARILSQDACVLCQGAFVAAAALS